MDRQQPTNQHGDHKVAIQLNHGSPSTIGQVVVNNRDHVSPKTVSFSTLQIHINSIQFQFPNVGCCKIEALCEYGPRVESTQQRQGGENP